MIGDGQPELRRERDGSEGDPERDAERRERDQRGKRRAVDREQHDRHEHDRGEPRPPTALLDRGQIVAPERRLAGERGAQTAVRRQLGGGDAFRLRDDRVRALGREAEREPHHDERRAPVAAASRSASTGSSAGESTAVSVSAGSSARRRSASARMRSRAAGKIGGCSVSSTTTIWLSARDAGNSSASAASARRVCESRGKNSSGSVTATDASRGAIARPPASAASQISVMRIARRNAASVSPISAGGAPRLLPADRAGRATPSQARGSRSTR